GMTTSGRYFPVFFDLRGARILVAGAGKVAERKIPALLAHGAKVTVVARKFSPAVRRMEERGEIVGIISPFRPEHLDGAEMALAATSDPAANRLVSREARRRGIPVNVADVPEECSFILPATVRFGSFTLAVSTGGKHPGAARALREFMEDRKEEISVRFERGRRRRDIRPSKGKVYIVGAGPGDPDLLTVRALGLLRAADAVIHDYLVPDEILSLASPKAAKVCFARRGKTSGHGSALKQNAIHEAMARLARAGKSVVRLKSGDPLVFGRGGEEAEFLAASGIPHEIVPGITAAVGCAASAGIPLTRRGASSSVTLLAGHEAEGKDGTAIDWERLPHDGTIAVYMGVARAAELARDLMEKAGFPPATPVAVVENGARRGQRVFRGRLAGLRRIAEKEGIRSPAILFVGKTAACAVASKMDTEIIEERNDGPCAKSV
ncbi:MAG: uroporphyrinogen-III C-methyltransferase, partial [Deltaproteobacteria bacterium]|nr:uroporphyrinogen-III C-methyltransferase [Deltaproteobacteria bacterium]